MYLLSSDIQQSIKKNQPDISCIDIANQNISIISIL